MCPMQDTYRSYGKIRSVKDIVDVRPGWDEYFMDLVYRIRTRATCPRAQVGAIVVLDNRVLGTGYNGSPKGHPHCTDAGCVIVAEHCVRTIHAEVNAVLDALQRSSVEGATLYTTHYPCLRCSQLLVQVGIRRVVYGGSYRVPSEELELRESLDIESEWW